MTENTTKVVSARLPLADYLLIAAAAGEKKMTVADYILLKLFADPDPSAEPLRLANEEILQLAKQITALDAKKTELIQTTHTWKKHTDTIQQDHKTMADELHRAKQQINQLYIDLTQQQELTAALTQQLQTAQDQCLSLRQHLLNLRQALQQADDDASTRLGQLGDKYWEIIDQFIPLQA